MISSKRGKRRNRGGLQKKDLSSVPSYLYIQRLSFTNPSTFVSIKEFKGLSVNKKFVETSHGTVFFEKPSFSTFVFLQFTCLIQLTVGFTDSRPLTSVFLTIWVSCRYLVMCRYFFLFGDSVRRCISVECLGHTSVSSVRVFGRRVHEDKYVSSSYPL